MTKKVLCCLSICTLCRSMHHENCFQKFLSVHIKLNCSCLLKCYSVLPISSLSVAAQYIRDLLYYTICRFESTRGSHSYIYICTAVGAACSIMLLSSSGRKEYTSSSWELLLHVYCYQYFIAVQEQKKKQLFDGTRSMMSKALLNRKERKLPAIIKSAVF